VGVLGLVWANFLNFCVVWRGAVPPVVRRKRDDRKQLAIMYAELFKRIPRSPTAKSLANEFADKEIRVLMSQNGMLINDLDPKSGRYVEKTKLQKIESLLSVIDTLILPNVLMLRANVQTRSDGSGATRGGESFLRVHWVAVPKVMRARRVNRRWRRRRRQVPPPSPTPSGRRRHRRRRRRRRRRGHRRPNSILCPSVRPTASSPPRHHVRLHARPLRKTSRAPSVSIYDPVHFG
jgi:hypothetical protein